MKTLRRFLLSVLLSAFTFFVVHDYAIADVDTDTQYKLCYVLEGDVTLDLPTQIHEHIHIPMSVPEAEPFLSDATPPAGRCPVAVTKPHSHISPTPTRPPLA